MDIAKVSCLTLTKSGTKADIYSLSFVSHCLFKFYLFFIAITVMLSLIGEVSASYHGEHYTSAEYHPNHVVSMNES